MMLGLIFRISCQLSLVAELRERVVGVLVGMWKRR